MNYRGCRKQPLFFTAALKSCRSKNSLLDMKDSSYRTTAANENYLSCVHYFRYFTHFRLNNKEDTRVIYLEFKARLY